jgi:hypothetical protein
MLHILVRRSFDDVFDREAGAFQKAFHLGRLEESEVE